ncbi:MFS transporter [Devosia submarina]|uniref:MFS transporter n=1 Tax=Devosia submarina TaxID=1173082 RepID=UPI002481B91E|nr:MFS transporter [Devosia submarina]
MGSLLAVLVNPLVGGMADRTGGSKFILIGLIILASVASATLFAAPTPLAVALVYLVCRFISAPLIPLSESILIANLAAYRLEFGRVRAWGSVSVVVTTLLCGYLVDWSGPAVIVILLTLVLAIQAGFALALPRRVRDGEGGPSSAAAITIALRSRSFLLLVGSAAISQACHGVFYAYSTFRWLDAGYTTFDIGLFWAIGVAAEIIAFACGGWITARLSPGTIIAIGCIAGVLRWGTFAYSTELLATLFMQLLQGATLGMTQIGVAAYLRRHIRPHTLSSATGSYAASSALIASLFIFAAGHAYAVSSGSVFLCASAFCVLALAVAGTLVRLERNAPISGGKAS